jgi:hypothetical protein
MAHDLQWFKASASSGTGNCVEAAHTSDGMAVRDSKAGNDGPVLRFTRAEWAAFLAGARDGEFELPA